MSAFILAPTAQAAYPEQPFELIVHAGAGGGSDTFARSMAHILETEGIVKQKINVVNKTGGAAANSLNYLASKKGDPYVLFNASSGPVGALARGISKAKVDDIVYLAEVIEDPNLLCVLGTSQFKDLKSLLAYAKENPNLLASGFSTVGGSEHISIHRIEKAAGVQFNKVAFGSGAACTTALLGGHLTFVMVNVNEQMGQIEAGKIVPLGTMTEERISFLPNVPTMKELGVNATFQQVRGFWAFKGFPDYAQKFWQDALTKLVNTKAFNDYVNKSFCVKTLKLGDQFKADIIKQIQDADADLKTLGLMK
jgi:putative tricarboxylic transport membrane protein